MANTYFEFVQMEFGFFCDNFRRESRARRRLPGYCSSFINVYIVEGLKIPSYGVLGFFWVAFEE